MALPAVKRPHRTYQNHFVGSGCHLPSLQGTTPALWPRLGERRPTGSSEPQAVSSAPHASDLISSPGGFQAPACTPDPRGSLRTQHPRCPPPMQQVPTAPHKAAPDEQHCCRWPRATLSKPGHPSSGKDSSAPISVSVSVFFYLSLSLRLCICVSVSLSLYLYVSLSLSVSVSISQCLSISHSLSQSLTVSFYLSHGLSISPSLFLTISVSHYVSLSITVSLSLSLFHSLSLTVSLSLTISISPSISLSLTIFISLCLSSCPHLSLSVCMAAPSEHSEHEMLER